MTGLLRPPDTPAPSVVLDSNVVLDWLVFRDPGCAALALAIESAQLRWIATDPMRTELAHVLGREPFRSRAGASQVVDLAWQRWSQPAPVPALGAAQRLHCSDADDQKFIDLALAAGASWLFSRDRALLKLARRARPLGVQVLRPADWADLQLRG